DFDRQYMRHMIEDHIQDVSEFKEEAKDGQDADIKSFAADKTPKLEEHLKMAKDIHGKVERG
ncbi:MAG: DUF4142 domain-containing protein, partial [Acidobacteriota bacterium]